MAVQFSFTERQWWVTVLAGLLIVALLVVVGFLAGALWQRRRVTARAAVGTVSPSAVLQMRHAPPFC